MYSITIFRHQNLVESILVCREEARATARDLRDRYPHRDGYRVEVTCYEA